MSGPTDVPERTVLDLLLAGSRLPVEAVERLIAGDRRAEDLLLEVIGSRAVRDDSWAPVWAIVALGERRSARALPGLLDCIRRGSDIVHEAVEFALLRYGEAAIDPTLAYLGENPGLEGRVHLYASLAATRAPRAVDYLIRQLRQDEECAAPIAWALAETGDPRAVAAIEKEAQRTGGRDADVAEALEAARGGEDLTNPLQEDWRTHWAFDEEEEEATSEAEEEPETMRDEESSLDLTPRYFDVRCPVCESQLEYDSKEGESRVLRAQKKQR